MSKTDEMLGENWGRTWLAVNFGALVGSRRGVSTDGVIAAGLVLLLLGQLKSLFNSDFLGNTRGWVTAYSVVKLVSLWAMEYGPALKEQNGTLSETVSKIIPAPEVVGQFLAVVVGVDGLLKYFAADGYAAFWGYGPLEPISSFVTIGEGYSLVMLAAFWTCLLRGIDVWKAYGVANVVYFLATVDATFIRKYELDVTEVGSEADLVLSFIGVVSSEAWNAFA